MKKFLKIYNKDRNIFKMINPSEKGFELIILNDALFKEYLSILNFHGDKGVNVLWQMKFKEHSYALYKNCKFSDPMDNFYAEPTNRFFGLQYNIKSGTDLKPFGKKFKVTCDCVEYYSNSVRKPAVAKNKFKDFLLLERMLKIDELNSKSE
jgi:hypothetical protein